MENGAPIFAIFQGNERFGAGGAKPLPAPAEICGEYPGDGLAALRVQGGAFRQPIRDLALDEIVGVDFPFQAVKGRPFPLGRGLAGRQPVPDQKVSHQRVEQAGI